jgi:uncharacterized protein (TIGR00251 family)
LVPFGRTVNKLASNNVKIDRLAVKVTPNAGRNEIVGFKAGVLQIKIGAPPDKGKANKELVDFLSEKLDVKKSAILIIKGQTSRNKVIVVEGLNAEEIQKRLAK